MSIKAHIPGLEAVRAVFLLGCYQFFLVLFGICYLTIRAIRGKGILGVGQRLSCYSRAVRGTLQRLDRPIWIHLVSVGEVLAAEPFIQELRRRFPEKSWVITTVTPTGQALAAQRLIRESGDQLLYLPWDFSPIVARAARAIRPSIFISFETELWPALFHSLNCREVPIVVVNGRISPSAYRRYFLIRPFMEWVLSRVTFFFTQSPQDARRYAAIGAPKDRILVTGNVKWDLKAPGNGDFSDGDSLRRLLGLSPQDLLWTAGSTHPGEESMVLKAYREVKTKIPAVRLLLAPRHPERCAQVEERIISFGLSAVRRSALGNSPSEMNKAMGLKETVILLDTLGELTSFYQASDLVFIGGSLVPHGGHNLIEPAIFSRPILTGPHLNNFQAVAEALGRAGGMIVVRSADELSRAVLNLIANPATREQLGRRAYGVIQEHRGATARTVDQVIQIAKRVGTF